MSLDIGPNNQHLKFFQLTRKVVQIDPDSPKSMNLECK